VESASMRLRITMFAGTPPPTHGTSVAVRQLLQSKFSEEFDVRHINAQFATQISEIDRLTTRKILLVAKYLTQLIWNILTFNPAYIIICPAFNRLSFLKDSLFIVVAGRIMRKRVLLWCHGNGLKDIHDRSSSFFRRFIEFVMKTAFCTIPVTRALPSENYQFFIDASRIHPIHYGISKVNITRSDLHSGHVTITYLSNMDLTKGWKVLVEASIRLCERHQNVIVNFYGGPAKNSPLDEIKGVFASTGFPTRIKYLGGVYGDKKIAALSETDIFCFPTYYPYESFGIVNLEAMRSGLPIVTTNFAGASEAVEDGLGGFLAKKEDVDDLVDKLEILIRDPQKRLSMGEYNRNRYLAEFTLESHVENWISLVRRLEAGVTKPKH